MNNGAETISWRIGYAEQGLEGPASAHMRFWRSIGSIGAFLVFLNVNGMRIVNTASKCQRRAETTRSAESMDNSQAQQALRELGGPNRY